MIDVFKYTNQKGEKSVKIVLVTGRTPDYVAGISLGSLIYKDPDFVGDVCLLNIVGGYEELDHIPRKGEGLPQFNKHFKMFKTENIQMLHQISLKDATQSTDSLVNFVNFYKSYKV